VSEPAQPPALARAGALCLLTGATGFIGGRLARRLLSEGYRVRALARAGSDTSALSHMGAELATGDVRDARSLEIALEGAQRVVHCAALVSDWATVAEISATNVQGTRNVVQAAARAGVGRLVHLSTTDIYAFPDGGPISETHVPSRFANWYAQTKLEAEGEVRAAQAAGSLQCVILRPATVYGPGSLEVIGEIARAIRGGHMLLIARGRPIAGLCYVENVLDAVLLALEHERAPGEAFNVTDGLSSTWRELCDALAEGMGAGRVRWSLPYAPASALGLALESSYRLLRRATGVKLAPLLSRQAVHVLGRDQQFSNLKLRQTLGWEPRVGFDEGLAATLAWLSAEGI